MHFSILYMFLLQLQIYTGTVSLCAQKDAYAYDSHTGTTHQSKPITQTPSHKLVSVPVSCTSSG